MTDNNWYFLVYSLCKDIGHSKILYFLIFHIFRKEFFLKKIYSVIPLETISDIFNEIKEKD